MLKKTITYTDYNGNERTEDFYFNLNKAEIAEMQMSTVGGLGDMIREIISTQNVPEIIKLFKKLILLSYGKKSPDGRRFIKNDELREDFEQTEAFSQLFMELANNDKSASDFVNGIIPSDMRVSEEVSNNLIQSV